MQQFIIKANDYLKQDIQGFHHTHYTGYKKPGNPDYINTLKNTFNNESQNNLNQAVQHLSNVLRIELPQILAIIRFNPLTVCVVPRAKAENNYTQNELLFKKTVKEIINELDGFIDGTDYITRHTNTKTTHLARSFRASLYAGTGKMPYVGITKDTCTISENVRGKNILLIDDVYTPNVNIDEDAIQALLDNGARNVYFYSIGKTMGIKYTENAINILTTVTYDNIGPAWIVKNLRGNESVDKIIQLINNSSLQNYTVTLDDFENKRKQIIEKINNLGESCDGIVAIGDKNFPKHRGAVKQQGQRPICLFYKGDINLLNINNDNISVIGLLNPDEKIEIREHKIVKELVNHNITIVSGLALGCDSIAHQEALNGGKTIAILPCPLNKILPESNKKLAQDIVKQGGLLVTEYYEDFKSNLELRGRYSQRDRLQAMFCDTIVLIASYSKKSASNREIQDEKLDSGARLAMEHAKNYNIPRAVMYDENTDSNNPMFDLNRQLLQDDKSVIILTKKNLEKIINDIKRRKTTAVNFHLNLFSEKLF